MYNCEHFEEANTNHFPPAPEDPGANGCSDQLARKRRKFTTIQVSERANISRSTLYHIERGSPTVALGAVFNVLCVLGLEQDFLKLAADDVLGRKLQDLGLNY